jgi:IclR family acetate operon transcriptional repressor
MAVAKARPHKLGADAPNQTLARGCELLTLFAGDHKTVSQTEAAEIVGVSVPTAHRILRTLESYRLVEREPGTGRYRVGLAVLELVPALLRSFEVPSAAGPYVQELADHAGETANLAMLIGGDVLYLVSRTPPRLMTIDTPPGLRLSAHWVALGKALLAQLDDDTARARLGEEPYGRRTQRTQTSWKELAASLDEIRRLGYAESIEEYEDGLCSCAVAVPTDGPEQYAVNFSLPVSRWSRTYVTEELVPRLQHASERIRRVLSGLQAIRPPVDSR